MLAYLISAYRDPEHLARLIKALDFNADFYVHIDANVDEAPFRAALPHKVKFVHRHAVNWGGWNQVAYQYELVKTAVSSGCNYSHLVCLSAQDYPLWSNSRIHAFFAEHAHEELMSGYNLTRGNSSIQRRKVTCVHPFRDLKWHNRWLRNKVIVASRTLLRYMGIRRPASVMLNGKRCDVFFGSDYWAITLACARWILTTFDGETALQRYFSTSFVPSEMCFQTIVFNSPFAAHALLHTGPYPGLSVLTPLHYIDYGACIKELTTEDLPKLTERNKMFCRKVVTGKSDALAEAIDRLRAADEAAHSSAAND